jgi:chromosome segregation ATPase
MSAPGYQNVELQMTQLSTLPESIESLESTIAGLRAKQVSNTDGSSSQNLPLPATLSLLAERQAELAALNRQLAAVQNALPRKTREAEAVERELSVLERRKSEAIMQAQEAKRKKQEGESDGLEEVGRWYRSADKALKQLVGVEG